MSDLLSQVFGALLQGKGGAVNPNPAPSMPAAMPTPAANPDILRKLVMAKMAQENPESAAPSGELPGGSDEDISELAEIPSSKVTLDPEAVDKLTGMSGRGPNPQPLGVKEKIANALHSFGLNLEGPAGAHVLAQEHAAQGDFEKAKAVARMKWQQEQDANQYRADETKNRMQERDLQKRGQDITAQDAKARLAETQAGREQRQQEFDVTNKRLDQEAQDKRNATAQQASEFAQKQATQAEEFKQREADRKTQWSIAQGARADARADKSYQYNSSQLDKLAQPVDQLAARMGRLNDTLAQKTPQGDALVAPELLTVMAGGQGSGLRMNEAEIARIVGGRSNWESLKASINKWKTDPKAAVSITDSQRQQIHDLTEAVNQKILSKQQAIQDGRDGLVGSTDPTAHRKIYDSTRQKLNSIDTGGASGGGGQSGSDPLGILGNAGTPK